MCIYYSRKKRRSFFSLVSLLDLGSWLYGIQSSLDCRLDSHSDSKDGLVPPVVRVQSVLDPHCFSSALYIFNAVRVQSYALASVKRYCSKGKEACA